MGLFDMFKKKPSTPKRTGKDKVTVTKHAVIVDHSDNLEAQIIPIEKRIRQLKPIAEGLYAHEILALSYAETFHLSGDEYQGFWWWHYGVRDVQRMLKSLQSRGFITEGGVDSAVRACKATELKEFLKSQGLKVGGKKDDLISRVLTEADPSAVQAAFPNRTYALTDKGRRVLEANMAIIDAHKDPMMRIWDVPEKDLNRPPKTNDERWYELNTAYMAHVQAGDFGLARNVRLDMAEFLASEGRYVDAIDTLCSVMAHDLSGVGNSYNHELFLQMSASRLFPYEESLATIPPGIIRLVMKYQKAAGMDDTHLQGLLLNGFERYEGSAPIRIFTPEESLKVFNLELAGDKAGLSAIYKEVEGRFYDMYPSAKR